jgi:hypothetical protein
MADPTPALQAYITPAEFKTYLGPDTTIALFDEGNAGFVDDSDAALVLVIMLAHAEVLSYLVTENVTLPAEVPATVSFLLKLAELDYAMAIAFQRKPEYVRTFGEDKRTQGTRDRAEKRMLDIKNAVREIPGAPKPANVGGRVTNDVPRLFGYSNGSYNGGDF